MSNILNMEQVEEKRYNIKFGEIAPFPQRFVDIAEDLGIDKIKIAFQGGSDEGYIEADCWSATYFDESLEIVWGEKGRYRPDKNTLNGEAMLDKWYEFEKEIEDWAWERYGYNGAGEGQDYGDDVVYHLDTGKVTYQDWGYQYVEGDKQTSDLETKGDIE